MLKLKCMDSKLGCVRLQLGTHRCFVCSFLWFPKCQRKVPAEKTKDLCISRRNIGEMMAPVQIVWNNTQVFGGLNHSQSLIVQYIFIFYLFGGSVSLIRDWITYPALMEWHFATLNFGFNWWITVIGLKKKKKKKKTTIDWVMFYFLFFLFFFFFFFVHECNFRNVLRKLPTITWIH